ncbi:hypothetical protein K2173_025486 [Erythroxylum novogranatense]|uniref:Uncharacterized protein n=1 Tax=Erythroxylum novogranatense TaxID=1862640 RepID=A0AAV8SB61_9ROSI|nr:hypothetical protein K2173_025486 [Erythroxylum novogranatense]
MESNAQSAKKVRVKEREEDPPPIEPPVTLQSAIVPWRRPLSPPPPPPTHDTPSVDPPTSTPQSDSFGPWMQVERRTRRPPPSSDGSRRTSPPQASNDGSRGSHFTALSPEVSSDAPTELPPSTLSPSSLVGLASSISNHPPSSSLRKSSRRDEKLKRSVTLAASRRPPKPSVPTPFAAQLEASLGSPYPPSPQPLPSPSLVFPLDQASSTGPATSHPSQPSSSLGPSPSPPPQASSTVGLSPTSLQLPQPNPTGLSYPRPNSAHVAISLPSHDALVSFDSSIPIPIPSGLGTGSMDEDPPELQGLMDTTPSPPLSEATPPRPPDPISEHQLEGVMPAHPDSPMADQEPVQATLLSLDPTGHADLVSTSSI